jgi:hypothetical protein
MKKFNEFWILINRMNRGLTEERFVPGTHSCADLSSTHRLVHMHLFLKLCPVQGYKVVELKIGICYKINQILSVGMIPHHPKHDIEEIRM